MARLQVTRTQHNGKVTYEVDEPVDIPTWGTDADLRIVGQPHARVEALDKVTGRARYSYDQRLPRQLYAAVLRSPHPHARIKRIDTRAAEQLAGVRAVL